MSVALCRKIFAFMEQKEMLKTGDIVVDPFAGIFTTGLIGAMNGYRVVGVELEEKFCKLSERNIEKNRKLFEKLGVPIPTIIQGDSRKLSEVIVEADATIFSPPFAGTQSGGGIAVKGYHNEKMRRGVFDKVAKRSYTPDKFRHDNISNFAEGSISAVLTSPPYAETMTGQAEGTGASSTDKRAQRLRAAGYDPERLLTPGRRAHGNLGELEHYPNFPGQIGSLVGGNIDSVITSPPYENQDIAHIHSSMGQKHKQIGTVGHRNQTDGYGEAGGQIGNKSKETYWSAMKLVYAECKKILKPHGWMAIVVKDFVRNKERVPLCDNTVKLLEHLGFKVKYRVRAWLVEDQGVPDMFHGKTKLKERKSFFRRLAESKGSPRIDWEEVIFCQKGI
jgi:hypothetical protein